LDFLPGQAVLVAAHGQSERRPYSIACSPERARDTGQIELLVGVENSGDPGPHLRPLEAGRLIDIEGPFGTFVFPEEPRQTHLLFVAGGTGIAPLRSMIDHALRRHPAHAISLLYSVRRHNEFAFIEELRHHAETRRLELHPTVTRDEHAGWAGGRGRIGRSHYVSVLHDPAGTLCFICGPKSMVQDSMATLQALGVPDAAIRTETWR
jgi:NAD(P)H-flavin reductase